MYFYKGKPAEQLLNYELHEEYVSYRIYTRTIDLIFASLGLIVAIPFIVVFGLAIKLEDGGPIFFKQERVGKNGKLFNVYKLRSMRMDAEKHGAQWATKNDPRVLKVGGFIRKVRIDELPQFWNMLKGEMSLIGPRPERPVFIDQFTQEHPEFINRLLAKPGLTGWAQVNGGYDMTPKEKYDWDIYYIQNRNIKMDAYIIFKTVKVVLTGDGAR